MATNSVLRHKYQRRGNVERCLDKVGTFCKFDTNMLPRLQLLDFVMSSGGLCEVKFGYLVAFFEKNPHADQF